MSQNYPANYLGRLGEGKGAQVGGQKKMAQSVMQISHEAWTAGEHQREFPSTGCDARDTNPHRPSLKQAPARDEGSL